VRRDDPTSVIDIPGTGAVARNSGRHGFPDD
jgi:hypothetical protein